MPYKDPKSPAAMASKKASAERYYAKNSEAIRQRALDEKQRCKDFVRSFKTRPCLDCGVEYPYYVMEFDHVRGVKVGNISRMVQDGHMAALLREIEKCEVVCANCHKARTFHRLSA